MRKSLWVVLGVLLAAAVVPTTRADTTTDGSINFTVSSGGPIPTGSFVFDDTTDTLTSYTVTWDGVVFNLQSLFASFVHLTVTELEDSGTWCGVASSASPPAGCFGPGEMTLSTTTYLVANTGTGVFTIDDALGQGSYVVNATTVAPAPEPTSVILTLIGIGFLLAIRKRVGHGFPLVSRRHCPPSHPA